MNTPLNGWREWCPMHEQWRWGTGSCAGEHLVSAARGTWWSDTYYMIHDGDSPQRGQAAVIDETGGWIRKRWRATDDDLIGGWCVVAADETRSPADGALQLASFLTLETAQHVAALHNQWLAEHEEGSA